MPEINPNAIYTTEETKDILRVSTSTIKRLLKHGAIRANKVGGQYRILGKELIRLLSPTVERQAVSAYQKMKHKVKRKIKNW